MIMGRKNKERKSAVQQASEDQAAMSEPPTPPTPPANTSPPPDSGKALESTDDGMLRTEGSEGGFFIAGRTGNKPRTAQTQPAAPAAPPAQPVAPDTPDLHNLSPETVDKIIQLAETLKQHKQQMEETRTVEGTSPPEPEAPPVQSPATQPPAKPTTPPQQPPAQQRPRTPMFGLDNTPPANPRKDRRPAQNASAPAQPATPRQPQPAAQPASPPQAVQSGQATGYIAQSRDGQGYALVLDGLTMKDLDYINYMAEYVAQNYPEAMPKIPDPKTGQMTVVAHPAPLTKFALNHLLIDIRKETAEKVQCRKCGIQFNVNLQTCPQCATTNRCATCNNLVGNTIYL